MLFTAKINVAQTSLRWHYPDQVKGLKKNIFISAGNSGTPSQKLFLVLQFDTNIRHT